ncbi:C-GCAxxG-C-C family protein [Oscillibacter sp.]|uniref:C-GCAxxG-C-C family protein n=1 Tax=Oscillibacter sp. TaxID=1945593 RepID=UPI00262A5AAA|nr:C-GCAxxG-C-C family protein [Oscillibacter sp.]MDD3346490.1 C-GCAxxG-C-C family protein [Oscillibacter sp.]
MNHFERASAYHKRGFNCCQSVVAAFSDLTGLGEQESFNIAGGFGAGAGTGELCGAVVGAVMTLGLLTPVDTADPVGSKKRTVALGKDLQNRFSGKFGALRCQDLLKSRLEPNEAMTPAAAHMGLTGHCDIMIVTAVEIVEEILKELR